MGVTRRSFLGATALLGAGSSLASFRPQDPGERPPRPDGVRVVNPRARVPVGLIVDD